MKYVVNLIVNEILKNIENSDEESLFLINGFEDLDIYLNICQNLTNDVKKLGKNITIKLAKNKWNYFKRKYDGEPSIHVMEQNDWVLTSESTTDYRNKHTSDILVLLGTESEDDISGSLKDIYQINCNELYNRLPIFNSIIDYSIIFENAGLDLTEDDKKVINKVYKDLFEFNNKDICKLSDFVDKIYCQITTINDFIEIFYKNLPSWGLPMKELKLPTASQLKGKSSKNILRSEYNFITGVIFKNISSSYKKYKSKLEMYERKQKTYSSIWEGWKTQTCIKSYEDFQKTVLDYIQGNRNDTIKTKLLSLDFSIIEDVLELKIQSESRIKKQVIKVSGSPIKAFCTCYLYALNEIKKNKMECNMVNFIFTDASIVSETSSDESDALREIWKNVCIHTNGIFEELSEYDYSIDGNDISLSYYPNDFFDITFDNQYVHAASSTKQMHKIQYRIECSKDENEIISYYEFEWNFKPNEEWLNEFSDISNEEFVRTLNNPYIPLTTLNKIEALIMKKSEEEFFDYLIEKGNLDYSINILEKSCHNDLFQKNDKYRLFYDLGLKFVAFCNEVSVNGLYNALSNKSGKATDLINSYNKLGDEIVKSKFDENEYFILDLFIHAFNIEKNGKSIISDKDIECCIVPPWHPASIEKIKHRNLFFFDGCNEFWKELEKHEEEIEISDSEINYKIQELNELSKFQSSVDVFPMSNTSYFGCQNSYGKYSLYAKKDLHSEENLRDLVKKEFVFDDEFKNNSYTIMNEDSFMLYGILQNYITAFPDSIDNLSLVFIDPSDLQPIISAIHKYIIEFQKKYGDEKELSLNISILVKPENKGGKNYISYWMNESFDLDSNVKIKTFMNEWKNKKELENLLNGNNDIVFVMDLLKTVDYEFINKIDVYKPTINECYFPIVFRPSPSSNTTTKRRIELTQPQFIASKIHTQVVHYRKNLEYQSNDIYYAVKMVDLDEDMQDLVKELHKKAYWVACIDACMDGKLLKLDLQNDEYSVIGFSTGKGKYGQYNITITARNSILTSIENNFSRRLSEMFKWDKKTVDEASHICMKEASQLDGISVLTASNQRDYKINEFMAYVLTSLRDKEKNDNSPLKIIVHLDSYKHWFKEKNDINNIFNDEFNESRPDFLILKVGKDFRERIKINATVVECKMAKCDNIKTHVDKAMKQVSHGIDLLSSLFDPNSKMLKRGYWFAQLYRALAFAQISFNNSSPEFNDLANKLRGILNGDFDIEWKGEILGYWLDMDGEEEIIEECDNGIMLYNIPQLRVQKLILGDENVAKFVEFNSDLLNNRNDYKEKAKIQEKAIIEKIEESKAHINDILINLKEEKEKDLNANNTPIISKKQDLIIEHSMINDKDESIVNENSANIRVLIGEDKKGQNVYWEFGNKQLANRHMLITGTSGQGKTYSIQTMLYELSKSNISSIVFDYTEGFREEQLEPKFLEKMGDKVLQHVVKAYGVPINPFKQHEIEVAGMKMLESPADVAGRFANILVHVYGFGDQQFAAIFEAARVGLEKYGKNMTIQYFQEELQNVKNKSAQSVISKMTPFFYSIKFSNDEFDWGNILYSNESMTEIFQLTMIDREMQVIVTELMLWDAWYYTKKHGNKDKPFVVILDEAQNLSHKINSPSAAILTEGRKFGWSAWFATQSLKVLSDDEVVRLLQSACKLYFKPTDEEIVKMAKQLDPTDGSLWLASLKGLKKGQCIFVSDRMRNDGIFGSVKPTVTSITSFEKRD